MGGLLPACLPACIAVVWLDTASDAQYMHSAVHSHQDVSPRTPSSMQGAVSDVRAVDTVSLVDLLPSRTDLRLTVSVYLPPCLAACHMVRAEMSNLMIHMHLHLIPVPAVDVTLPHRRAIAPYTVCWRCRRRRHCIAIELGP